MLIDRYGRRIDYLRISVTDRCNLRCEYCMPAEGTDVFEKGDVLTYEELERVIAIAARLGLLEVPVHGGRAADPARDRAVPRQGQADSRRREPRRVDQRAPARAARRGPRGTPGVDKLNISVDSFDRATFAKLTRRDVLPTVLNGLEAATRIGAFTIKLNAVLLRGINDHELADFLDVSIRTSWHVRFIEYMPYGEWHDRQDLVVPCGEIIARIEAAGFQPDRGPSGNGPARYWRHPGAEGTVGVISPVTNKFCENCNRLRINARGELRGCLLDEGSVPLRPALQVSDDAVRAVFERVLITKPEKHYDLRTFHMSTIGG